MEAVSADVEVEESSLNVKESFELIPRVNEMSAVQESNNLVVAFCLDGSVYALDGESGAVLWKAVGSFSEGPLLQKKKRQGGHSSTVEYLVEPLGDGAIFQVESGEGKEVKRLPFTLKSLVHLSPVHWRESDERALYLIAKRESSIFVLDLLTGRVRRKQFKRSNEEDEAGLEIAPLERASLLVGRTDYHVQGFDEGNLEAQWEIVLTQFKSVHDSETSFEGESDDFYTTFNGHLVSKQVAGPWIANLGSPVLQIFRPATAPNRFVTLREIPLKGSANNAVAAKRHVQFDRSKSTFYFDDLVNVGALSNVTEMGNSLMFALPQSHYPVVRKDKRPMILGDAEEARHQFLSVQRVARQTVPSTIKLLGHDDGNGWNFKLMFTGLILIVSLLVLALRRIKRAVRNYVDSSGVLKVSEEVLGYGSHGTLVLRGTFDGRPVAVKRLLAEFYSLADHEISLLQTHDTHQNVVRYFYREQQERFILVALELAQCSLHEFIGGTEAMRSTDSYTSEMAHALPLCKEPIPDPSSVDKVELLRQIMLGLEFLHEKGLIHRDLKPQNILLQTTSGGSCPRVLISDFGLSRKLVEMESSFHATAKAAGTLGWRAPEIIFNEESVKFHEAENKNDFDGTGPMKIGKSVDIFAVGLIFYFVLSEGGHAFGSRLVRESNISTGKLQVDSTVLSAEADDLIRSMLRRKAKDRPTAGQVLVHPFFWNSERRLEFICMVSDVLEAEEQVAKREQAEKAANAPPGFESVAVLPLRDAVDSVGMRVFGDAGTWHKLLDRTVFQDLTRHRFYMVNKLHDLLRAIRNKRNHFHETPETIQEFLGKNPIAAWNYFEKKFPRLLMETFTAFTRGSREVGNI